MSKASEWADRRRDAGYDQAARLYDEAPRFRVNRPNYKAGSAEAGRVGWISNGNVTTLHLASLNITDREAIDFAHWILDTFADPPGEGLGGKGEA